MKTIACLAVLVIVASSYPASDTSECAYARVSNGHYRNYFGISGGNFAGYGLSYRRWVNDAWAFQVNLFPYYSESTYPEDGGNSDRDTGYAKYGQAVLGVSVLRSLALLRYVRMTAQLSISNEVTRDDHDYYATQRLWNDSLSEYTPVRVHKKDKFTRNRAAIGIAFGPEIWVWRFSVYTTIGLFASYVFEKDQPEMGPAIDGGVHFRL